MASSPSQNNDKKDKILRNQTRHLSFETNENERKKNNAIILDKDKEKEKSLEINQKSMFSIPGESDYQHSLSPTSKVKMRAEIFIHLKQGTIDTSYSIGELLGEGN